MKAESRRKGRIFAAATAMSVVMVAFSQFCSTAASAAAPKVLHRGTSNEPRTMDPQHVQGNAGAAMMYDLFEGLLSYDTAGNIIPGIAESWSVSDDGLTYTFKLRPGVKFSDGHPITAEDFVYSFRRAVDPATAARAARIFFPIKNAQAITRGEAKPETLGARAVDPRTVEVVLMQPTPYFPELMASFSAAAVPRHVIEPNGDKWTTPGTIVTSGAYVLQEWINNTHVKLVRNPNYYDAANVRIDEVVFYPIERPSTALTRFRAGEIDVAFNIPTDRLEWAKQNMAKELRSGTVSGIYYLLVNNSRETLGDVRVRKALSISLDRDQIVALLEPGNKPAYNLVPPSLPNYGENPMPFAKTSTKERIAEAKELLKQAGYGPGGKVLKLNLKTGGQENNRRVTVAVQAMWKEIGVQAEIENVGARSIVADSQAGNYDVMRYTYYAAFQDAVSFLKLLESRANINFSSYSNPKFDELLANADKLRDPNERVQALRAAERVAMEDYPVIPVYFYYRYYLVSQRVKGWVENPRGEHLARYLDIEN
jgi:oligopeptide transport system substrate-binding protein